ncbi:unnamed protein product [Caenorhabditis brenneri]
MRLLIPLLVAVGVAASSKIKLDGNATDSDPQAVSVAYQQILAISMAVCKGDKSQFNKLVSKAIENPKEAKSMMKNWSSVQPFIQWARKERADEIIASAEFTLNKKNITGRFIFEKKTNKWVLTDLPPILLSDPKKQ